MTLSDFAIHFVNCLVPGKFNDAKAMLSEACKYSYQGEVLTGPEIIKSFEENHYKAQKELDKIEYLNGHIFSEDSDEVVVKVFDKISLNGKTHTYSDRLAIKAIHSDAGWEVTSIEHRPFEEERKKLKKFLASAGPKQ